LIAPREPSAAGTVACATVLNFVTAGCVYSFVAFIPSLQEAFRVSVAQVTQVQPVALGLYFALGWLAGLAADRWGARYVASSGAGLAALGLIVMANAANFGTVRLGFGLGLGIGIGLSFIPSLAAAMRALPKPPLVASATVTLGVAAGTAVMPWVAQVLIASLGWRVAERVFGVLCLAAAALSLAFLPRHQPAIGQSVRAALRARAFWHVVLAGLVAACGFQLPYIYFGVSAGLRSVQLSPAALVAAIGLGNIVGRLISLLIRQQRDIRSYLAMAFLGMAISLAFWIVTYKPWNFLAVALGFGICFGIVVACTPVLITFYFGQKNTGAITGLAYVAVGVGSFVGPLMANHAVTVMADFTTPIAAGAAIVSLVAAVLIWSAPSSAAENGSAGR
jgi:MFS transporter, OFA family, oxalate/formate antiporter